MKNYFIISLAIFTLLSCENKKKKEDTVKTESVEVKAPKTVLTLVGETTNLPALESVIFDERRNLLYVSINIEI
tara:strand:- start:251 stop:472 length:222 start_codon:yes stop_codon:yes gene_type:complete